jgi:hypothetical protein
MRIATPAAADGTANRPRPSDHSTQMLFGFTIAGTRITTARHGTHRRGFAMVIRTTALSAVAPGATRAISSAQRFANINVRFDTLGFRIASTMNH